LPAARVPARGDGRRARGRGPGGGPGRLVVDRRAAGVRRPLGPRPVRRGDERPPGRERARRGGPWRAAHPPAERPRRGPARVHRHRSPRRSGAPEAHGRQRASRRAARRGGDHRARRPRAWRLRLVRIHVVGIGGTGMSAIARVLLARGHGVSGSDAGSWPLAGALARDGATVHQSFDAAHIAAADVVLRSSAYGIENAEVRAATDAGVLVWTRADAWRELSRGERVVAIAGTH